MEQTYDTSPTFHGWPNLPIEIKSFIIGKMPTLDKFSIRLCSSLEKVLVDDSPVNIRKVRFLLYKEYEDKEDLWFLTREDSGWTKRRNFTMNNKKECFEGNDVAANAFLKFFSNRNSIISTVEFLFLFTELAGLKLIENMINEARRKNIRFRIKKGFFIISEVTPPLLVQQFLMLFDENVLSTLELRSANDEIVAAMSKTKQWKNCSELGMNSDNWLTPEFSRNYNFDDFLHFDKTIVKVETLNPKDAYKFIENCQSKPSSTKTVFQIYASEVAPSQEILNLFEYKPPAKNDSGLTYYEFPTKDRLGVLKVYVSEFDINGFVVMNTV